MLGQRLQLTGELIAVGAETQFNGEFIEPLVESGGIIRAGTFIDDAGQHIGQARTALRILRCATFHREFQRDERHGVIFNQPRFDPAGGYDTLNARGVRGHRNMSVHHAASSFNR